MLGAALWKQQDSGSLCCSLALNSYIINRGQAMRGSTITLEDYPVEQALDLFRAAGFDSLEMWKHHLKRCRTADLRRKFAAYAAERSIAMGGFNAVGEDYFQPFDGDLKETLE